MKIYNLTAESFPKEIESFKGTVLIDFFAEWCTPCKMLTPVIEDVASNAGKGVKICKVNVESEKELAKKGYITIPGRVSRRYYEEKLYGKAE